MKLAKEQPQRCERVTTEEELLNTLKKTCNNKSPGNNRITKELYQAFWDNLKTLLLSVSKAFKVEELSVSQKQAVAKLIQEKDKDKLLTKNWRLISLLNVDTKFVLKNFSQASKSYTSFPNIFKSNGIFKRQVS